MLLIAGLAMLAFFELAAPPSRIADLDRVVSRWHLEGTHMGPLMGIAASGRRINVECIRIDRIAEGKIVESWMQWDSLGLLEQIGALPKLRREPLHEAARMPALQETRYVA